MTLRGLRRTGGGGREVTDARKEWRGDEAFVASSSVDFRKGLMEERRPVVEVVALLLPARERLSSFTDGTVFAANDDEDADIWFRLSAELCLELLAEDETPLERRCCLRGS